MTKTPTEEAVESIKGLTALSPGAFARAIDRGPYAQLRSDLRLILSELSRLQAERDRAVNVMDGLLTGDQPTRPDLALGAIRCALGVTTDGEVKPWLQTAIDFLTGSYEPLEEAEAATLPPPVKEAEPEPVAWAELAEAVARFLHDEVDLPDKFVNFHWPEHDGDDGFRGDDAWVKIQPIDIVSHYRESAKRIVARFFSTPPALQARGPRDAMLDRSEEEWEALEEATVQVYSLRAGHTLTDDDIAALHLVDRCQREDEESATDAYHRGLETGLRKRGGDELVNLEKRVNDAIISRTTEKAMRALAEQRANAAEFVLSLCLAALQARVEALEAALERQNDPARHHGGGAGAAE